MSPVAPVAPKSPQELRLELDPLIKAKVELNTKEFKLKTKELNELGLQMKLKSRDLDLISRDMAAKSKDIQLAVRSRENGFLMIEGLQAADGTPLPKGIAYIDGMRDAGYPLNLDKDMHSLVALKSVGVTPEYARAMNGLGLGKPSVHELITLKAMNITPDYVASLKQQGVTPLSVHEVISMKAQGVSPEYAAWFKQHFPQGDASQMRRASIFHIDDKFLAQARAHGFDDKDFNKVLRLKTSGLLDD